MLDILNKLYTQTNNATDTRATLTGASVIDGTADPNAIRALFDRAMRPLVDGTSIDARDRYSLVMPSQPGEFGRNGPAHMIAPMHRVGGEHFVATLNAVSDLLRERGLTTLLDAWRTVRGGRVVVVIGRELDATRITVAHELHDGSFAVLAKPIAPTNEEIDARERAEQEIERRVRAMAEMRRANEEQ